MIKGSWKQTITVSCLSIKINATNHKVTKQIQFLGSVMLVFRYLWEIAQGNCHKFHTIRYIYIYIFYENQKMGESIYVRVFLSNMMLLSWKYLVDVCFE